MNCGITTCSRPGPETPGCRPTWCRSPRIFGFVDELRVKDNQFVHKGDVLLVIDRARYTRALATAEANVAARKADMENAAQQAARRVRLTTLSISDEARQSAVLTANSAAAA